MNRQILDVEQTGICNQGSRSINMKIIRELAEESNGSVYLIDRQGQIRYSNGNAGRRLGFIPDDMRGVALPDLCCREDLECFKENIEQLFQGNFREFSARFVHSSKPYVELEFSGFPLPVSDEEESLALLICRSEQEPAYRETHGELRQDWEETFNAIADPVFIVDENQEILFLNKAARETLDISGEVRGRKICPVIGCDQTEDKCSISQAFHSGQIHQNRIFEEKKCRFHHIACYPVKNPDGIVDKAVVYLQDITPLLKAYSRSELFALALKTTHECIIIYDTNERIIFTNDAVHKMFGYTAGETTGGRFSDFFLKLIPGEHAEMILGEAYKQGWQGEMVQRNRNGQNFVVSASFTPAYNNDGKLVAVLVSLRDLTHEMEVQQKLLHSERLRSLGEMLSGIAHELNNPLTGIVGYAEILAASYDNAMGDFTNFSSVDFNEAIQTIRTQAERASRIIRSIRDFAKNRIPTLEEVNVGSLVRKTGELMITTLRKEQIKIAFQSLDDLPVTLADPYQIQQVFVNIINNACHAIKSIREEGLIKIDTYHYMNFLMVEFKDNGPGIPTELMAKVFDPFFTTKKDDEGTGLGLSLSYGIMKNHGGDILVKNNDWGGATFLVKIPIRKVEYIGTIQKKEQKKKPYRDVRLANLKVLTLDGEKTIRELAAQIARLMGFEFIDTAGTRKAALELLRNNTYDLIISEDKFFNNPGVNLSERLKGINILKNTGIVVMSSELSLPSSSVGENDERITYISKPFATIDMMEKIREVVRV